jgi:hypothetical protein
MRLPINMICVSAWLLLNVKSVFFQLHFLNHGENKLILNEIMTKSNMLSWIFIVQAHWNNRLRIDMSPHSHMLSGFWRDRSSNLRFIALLGIFISSYASWSTIFRYSILVYKKYCLTLTSMTWPWPLYDHTCRDRLA